MCRDCFNAYYRKKTKENPEARRKKELLYKQRNPEKYAAKLARHHKRAVLEGKNKYCNRNLELTREYERKRWAENPNRREWDRNRWKKRKANGYNERAKELYSQDPSRRRESVSKRRIAKLGAKGFHTFEEFRIKLEYYGYRCCYCGKQLDIHTATEDHRIPLSRGGTDWIANILPSCKPCNSSKGTKKEKEYYEWLRKNKRAD
jgi:5-methylcytosine-specific restriction endonuclease McrA